MWPQLLMLWPGLCPFLLLLLCLHLPCPLPLLFLLERGAADGEFWEWEGDCRGLASPALLARGFVSLTGPQGPKGTAGMAAGVGESRTPFLLVGQVGQLCLAEPSTQRPQLGGPRLPFCLCASLSFCLNRHLFPASSGDCPLVLPRGCLCRVWGRGEGMGTKGCPNWAVK